jgi:hypothetical protein
MKRDNHSSLRQWMIVNVMAAFDPIQQEAVLLQYLDELLR